MTNRIGPNAATVIAFCAALFFMIIPRSAVDAKRPVWDFNFSLGAGYDDNVLNYSDADLDQFDSLAADSSAKFAIDSKDDYIISPRAEIILKTKALKHSLHIGFNAGYNIFSKNDIKNYGSFGFWFREYLNKKAYCQLSGSYIPNYYYRNLFLSAGKYEKAHYDKFGLGAKFLTAIYRGFSGSVSYRYENRDFNRIFDERDLKTNNFSSELIYRSKQSFKCWGGYEFSIARAAGRNDFTDRRDVSYDAFLFWVGSRLYFKGINDKNMNAGAMVSYKNTLFQTDKLTHEDRYRFGRKDDRWSITISVNHDLNKKATIGLLVNHVNNSVDLPAVDLKPFLDYNSTSAKIVFDYSF
jgi:hypothetical protein